MRIAGLAVGLAIAALLAGCGEAPQLPPPLTEGEVRALIAEQNAGWWASMFPGETQPVVQPVAYVDPNASATVMTDCLLASGVPGVRVISGGITVPETGDERRAFQRAQFRCVLLYPVRIADPTAMGYLSDAQLDYVYDYYASRLLPCLRTLGFTIRQTPSREAYLRGGYGHWIPRLEIWPIPTTPDAWKQIGFQCPPPPFGPDYRSGMQQGG